MAASRRGTSVQQKREPILKDLHSKPKSAHIYIWCDYVELNCLVHSDHRFSRDNLSEILEEDKATLRPAGDPPFLEYEEEEEDEDDDLGFIEMDELADRAAEGDRAAAIEIEARQAAKDIPAADQFAGRSGEIFQALMFRAALFGESYPFVVDAHEIRVREYEEPVRKFYLQLLISASLRLVPKKRRKELTEPFEAAAHQVFRCLMPNGWEVHRFGAKGAAQAFKGKLFDRMQTLAQSINERTKLERKHYSARDVGDGGLDLVAWHPLGNDGRMGLPIALAQCGCTAEEWTLKMLEASPSKIRIHMEFHHAPATYYFMPQDLVEHSNGRNDWQRKSDLAESIVIDRLRLIKLVTAYNVAANCITAENLIQEAYALGAEQAA